MIGYSILSSFVNSVSNLLPLQCIRRQHEPFHFQHAGTCEPWPRVGNLLQILLAPLFFLSCTYPGLLLLQPVFFDQLPTQKLTNGGLGQPIPDFHFLGHLVRSQPFLTEINYFLFGRSLPLLPPHKSLAGFTENSLD